MIVTYKEFQNLQFPLYVLPSDNWFEVDGVVFLNDEVLDERNMPGKTLGIRRVQSRRRDLLKLNKAVLGVPELIRTRHKYFIDSSGYCFIYEKTYNSRLKTYRIKKVEKKEVASLLWLEGNPAPFTLSRPPLRDFPFVRMLHYEGSPWLVYDYVRSKPRDTYRRV